MLLSKVANLGEKKRELIVDDLLSLGVYSHNGKDVRNLEYHEAKTALVIELIKRG
ncbi:hypothetical protein NSQ82_16600 [Caldifermentibacillus hisashii]|uniref:hypothetical protein n=1 Tax=Caldifermentibacillus hisashii TaxID=996558 RepID=UPI0031B6A940